MGQDPSRNPLVILIAPNLSSRMGGEAIKALQIYQGLDARGVGLHQITHARVREELSATHPGMKVTYIPDDRLDRLMIRNKVLGMLGTPRFLWRAARVARAMIRDRPGSIIHYTSPISPVVPLFRTPGAAVVVGPINGNIHYPAAFRAREGRSEKFRRLLNAPAQLIQRVFFRGRQAADVLLVAGGERTYRSLKLAGCRPAQFRDSLDSGIPDALRERPPIEHRGENFRFVHVGRLVPYKGADLAIKALARTRHPARLDVIGRGVERPGLEALVAELGLGDRVRFIDWLDQARMFDTLREYRGFVFPSLAEANGMVVQEAMMIGLPVICLDWGGPGLLLTPETGFLIPPTDEAAVIDGVAAAMDRLGEDGELAASMARAGRQVAIDRAFSWSAVIDRWIEIYRGLGPPASSPIGAEAATTGAG